MKIMNPVIPGYNPDPSVVRVENDYYLATSSFEYLPGIPIFHSSNLIDWTQIGNVAEREDQLQAKGVPTAGGAWAPTLRYHEGIYYLAVADAMGRGLLIFTADQPAGPWSDGIPVRGVSGIDPDLAWDNDGNCYMTFSGLVLDEGEERGRHNGIQQLRIDPESFGALEEPRSIWSGTGLMFPEAPHLYYIDDWWYLVIAEGGTERGHCVSVARSRIPEGPYRGCPCNPVLSARSTERRVQNSGHGDLVQAVDGSWYMIMLGMQTRGMTRSFSPLGRQSFLTSVEWKDQWPVPQPVIVPEDREWPGYRCDFNDKLDPSWISIRRLPSDCAESGNGRLILRGEGTTMDAPSPIFVGRKVGCMNSCIRISLKECKGIGGLSIRYDEDFHFDIEFAENKVLARAGLATIRQKIEKPVKKNPASLYIESRLPTSEGPGLVMSSDLISLGWEDSDGLRHEVACFDGRFLTAETTCSFTGRVAGIYCVKGEFAVDSYTEEQI